MTTNPHHYYVINDCGIKDPFPVIAEAVLWGYGSSGTFGASQTAVYDRFHDLGHSGFYGEDDFVEKFWVPALEHGDIVPGPKMRKRSGPILTLIWTLKPKYWLIPVLVALVAWLVLQ